MFVNLPLGCNKILDCELPECVHIYKTQPSQSDKDSYSSTLVHWYFFSWTLSASLQGWYCRHSPVTHVCRSVKARCFNHHCCDKDKKNLPSLSYLSLPRQVEGTESDWPKPNQTLTPTHNNMFIACKLHVHNGLLSGQFCVFNKLS